MKKVNLCRLTAALAVAATVVWTGCTASQQQQQQPQPKPAPAPAPQPKPSKGAYGPSSSSFEEGGVRFVKGTMAFPTGVKSSSGLLLEKIVPAEVMVGQKFEYAYRVINLTDYALADVSVMDQVSANFKKGQSDPQPAAVKDGVAEWAFDRLEPGKPAIIKVYGTVAEEGTVTTCGWASYSPILCEPINVLRAALTLAKSAPAEVLVCDAIPMKLTVANTGSSTLTGVKVTDTLPSGLTSESGQQSLSFDVGTLAPNQSKELAFNAKAARAGTYVNTAKVTSAQGVEAEASSKTVVRQPVLQIACSAPASRFAGRPATVELTVQNTGDGVCAGTTVQLPLPAGTSARNISAGGSQSGTTVVWNVGNLAPKAAKKVSVDLVKDTVGAIQLTATARCACASPVTTSCSTDVRGIPAILLEVIDLDDPIEVGNDETYVITITNQGSAPDKNIKVSVTLEDAQTYVSATGAKVIKREGKRIDFDVTPSLAPKAKASFRVTVKAAKAENVRFKVSMTSDMLTRPVEETESTNQY